MNGDYDIQPLPAPVDPNLLAVLAKAQTSTLGHWRLWGLCRRDIRPLQAGPTVVGTAVTLALPGADSVLLHHALGLLRPGDILMIDRLHDDIHACIGGITALAAQQRGATAIVVDGPVTDVEELRALNLPIWHRGVSGRTTRRLDLGGRLNTPVSIGGAVVLPGDAVLCDADGVLVLPAQGVTSECARVEAHHHREADLQRALRAGAVLEDLVSPRPPAKGAP